LGLSSRSTHLTRKHKDCGVMEIGIGFEDGFARSLIGDTGLLLIESTCVYCGLNIVVPTVEELVDDEERHREKCKLWREAA
jgi:hypothetical protein